MPGEKDDQVSIEGAVDMILANQPSLNLMKQEVVVFQRKRVLPTSSG
jgi:hypothetical protein